MMIDMDDKEINEKEIAENIAGDELGEVDKLKNTIDELTKQLKLVYADMINASKRYNEELVRVKEKTKKDTILTIIPVYDHICFALAAAKGNKEIQEGIQFTLNNFLDILETAGIKKIDTHMGDTFNSKFHEAVATKESSEDDKILEIRREGFITKDGLLVRPAEVIVSVKEKQ